MKREHVSKKDLLNFVKGHILANKLIEEEREKRISQLGISESLREYKDLCKFWENVTSKEVSEDFERQKISFLIKRRELLNSASGIKK